MARRVLTLNKRTQGTLDERRTTEVSLVVSLYDDFALKLLFSADINSKGGLDDGVISPELYQEFMDNGIALSDNAPVFVAARCSRWHITDDRIYIVRRVPQRLDICVPVRSSIGKVRVSLAEAEQQAIRNLSGYYVFTDLKNGHYTIQVTSDHYFDEAREVDLLQNSDDPRQADLVTGIVLKPLPSYPFPPGTTLVKGMIKNEQGQPISGAMVVGRGAQSWTTERGEFVLYFTPLTGDDITTINGTTFLTGSKDNLVILKITHPHLDYRKESRVVKVEEGRTNSVSITMRPNRRR
jgi:hypothetical protein